MKIDHAKLTHEERIEGLSREDLKNLRALIDGAIARIEEAGKIDMWVVSDQWVNLHWDTSYARACLFMERLLKTARTDGDRPEQYEMKHYQIFAAEMPEYEASYGREWVELQSALDKEMAQEGGK